MGDIHYRRGVSLARCASCARRKGLSCRYRTHLDLTFFCDHYLSRGTVQHARKMAEKQKIRRKERKILLNP